MQIFVLPLSDFGQPTTAAEKEFLNLPIPREPYVLRLVIYSTSAITNHGSVWCNVPIGDAEFGQEKYHEYTIKAQFSQETYIDIKISKPGTFSFYTTYLKPSANYFNEYEPMASKNTSEISLAHSSSHQSLISETYGAKIDNPVLSSTQKFYFIVSSGFSLNGKELSLNSLAIQTVVSKWMGPYKTWGEKLATISKKGYNMIHFTPLHKRGSSNSPYSIFDQLAWDPICFPNGESDVQSLVESMEKKHGLLSMSDVVYNHTAHNSEWLKHHPEAGYSIKTAPHLTCALQLEDKLIEYSGRLEELGLPANLKTEDDLLQVIKGVERYVIIPLKLWEYYVIDVYSTLDSINAIIRDSEVFKNILPTLVPEQIRNDLKKLAKFVVDEASINFDKFGSKRFIKSIDVDQLISIIKSYIHDTNAITKEAHRILDEINEPLYIQYDEDFKMILDNLEGRTRYNRIQDDGPKLGEISLNNPLPEIYFTRVKTVPSGEIVALVNNGFIWNGDPMVDFAGGNSRAYLRREVISWGDCVKLRYGSKPEDSPFLWDHMTKYSQLLAKYFHGFRIDNCHSTPIHVGEYMLSKARLVRPTLYIAAELFSGSEQKDRIFVERFGITSLIREAMQAWSPGELSRLVHKHGGMPIGSFSRAPLLKHGLDKDSLHQEVHLLRSSPIHALFMDCTHDNESAADKRTVEDTLPNAALVAMCACAVGSTMSYDECYPHALNIVNERRFYTFGGGIADIKTVLYKIHEQMGQDGAIEMYVHHEDQYITVHRVDPKQGRGWFLIARTKFSESGDQRLNDVRLTGTRAKCALSVSLQKDSDKQASNDVKYVYGIPTRIVELEHPTIEYNEVTKTTVLKVPDYFPQGSIAVVETWIVDVDRDLDSYINSGAENAVKALDLLDLNVLLYKCDSEEREYSTGQDGVYNIPEFGSLSYAGLQGWISPLEQIVVTNDVGHPICNNLRQGHWALDYTVDRLEKYLKDFPNLKEVLEWLKSRFTRIKRVPSFVLPRYFAIVIYNLYSASRARSLSLMSKCIGNGTFFLQNLALTSIQMLGKVPSTSIFPFDNVGSMAAGLPHFSHDYMRCWGRDVFISLRGLLLVTGRFEEAKQHILAFAATLKHGLIPNLLDAGRDPRYNARDATWFFLQVIQDYCQTVPDGVKLLDVPVKRRFPLDDTYVTIDDKRAFSESTTIREIIYEILSRHAKGIHFREANAGSNLDSQMRDEGFNQKIIVDWSNGMIFGGNEWNCGTWMDKMGESAKAGNQGIPGTPRDGAAIEITGLLKSTLRWINQLRENNLFDWDYVINQYGEKVALEEWDRILQSKFEYCYYVPDDSEMDNQFDVNCLVIHRRGIYKDLYRSSKEYEDYQLRPNFAIAMTVAPELFNVDHALGAIAMADSIIRGPVGMKTLDPEDLNYRPYYRNSVDNNDFATAKGRNYHQGPEWIWCSGYFLRAFMLFDLTRKKEAGDMDYESTFQQLAIRLQGARNWIRTSPWAGLTELTNKDGEVCDDSSPTQAWSSATLIEVFEDARLFLEYHKREELNGGFKLLIFKNK